MDSGDCEGEGEGKVGLMGFEEVVGCGWFDACKFEYGEVPSRSKGITCSESRESRNPEKESFKSFVLENF